MEPGWSGSGGAVPNVVGWGLPDLPIRWIQMLFWCAFAPPWMMPRRKSKAASKWHPSCWCASRMEWNLGEDRGRREVSMKPKTLQWKPASAKRTQHQVSTTCPHMHPNVQPQNWMPRQMQTHKRKTDTSQMQTKTHTHTQRKWPEMSGKWEKWPEIPSHFRAIFPILRAIFLQERPKSIFRPFSSPFRAGGPKWICTR